MSNGTIEFGSVIDTTEVDVNITSAVKRKKLNITDISDMETEGSGDKFLSDKGIYKYIEGGIEGDYYKIDGSVPIIAPFSGGGQVFSNAAYAVNNNDLTTLEQVEDKIEIGVYNRRAKYKQNKG